MPEIHSLQFTDLDGNNHYIPEYPGIITLPETLGEGFIRADLLSSGVILGTMDATLVNGLKSQLHREPGFSILLPVTQNTYRTWLTESAPQRNGDGELISSEHVNIVMEREYVAFQHNKTREKTIYCDFNPESLEQSIGDIVPARLLRSFIQEQDFQPEIQRLPITADIKLLARQIDKCPYQGDVRQLYLEAKALEMLALVFASLDESRITRNHTPLSTYEISRIYDVKERLSANMQDIPSLRELAHAVGLNEKKLNAGFKQLFGMTVFAWLRQQRLQYAAQLLEEGKKSIKEITALVGFKHVPDFSTAFKTKFGVTPGAYKRSR